MIRAATFQYAGLPLTVERIADLVPGAGQMLVKVSRCGICGSDLHMSESHELTPPPGTVLGHEFAGEVVEIGAGVDGFRAGDRVTSMPIFGCGRCAHCLDGNPSWCDHLGYLFGGFAEYVLVAAATSWRLPSTLSSEDAALAEPLAVGLHGVAEARIEPGANVLIQGAGAIGLAALFWARRLGAGRVDVIEGAERRAQIASAMGANQVTSPLSANDAADAGAAQTDLYDVVIECVGIPGMLSQSLSFLRLGGTIVSLGACFGSDSIVPAQASFKRARLLFPQLYTCQQFELALKVLDSGAVEPRLMVTDTISLDELPATFEGLRRNPKQCKVLVNPSS